MKIGRKAQDNTDNRGMSLVELIVVMGIMAVMVALLSLGLPLMFSHDADSVANIIDDQLTEVRMLSMTKPGTYSLKVHTTSDYSKDNTVIINDGTSDTVIALGKTVKISAEKKNGSVSTWSASSGNDFVIVFDKGNGCVKTVGGDPADGVYQIKVESNKGLSSKKATVNLVALTGRHYVEKQ